ncbi:lipopolysaccharide biosynthesis protein [Halopseudomonas pelagia]|uniref:Polysaccharide biosynthesis protein n=2 Tax=Halopseudomonas pelagia TaxID=553151 RepID=A0AA91U3G9_9GAMM|nr:polysaccharide biosynthesis protein [Halopseudomonas pelagia]QFY55650.1 lipopolysaccharide biosynthesis protein [Halopseudomonas pelagia]
MPDPPLSASAVASQSGEDDHLRRSRVSMGIRELTKSKLLRNILTVVSGTAGAQMVAMAFMPIITRLYGPENYGVLGVFLGLVAMTVPVAALTYPMSIVLPSRDDEGRNLVKLSIILAIGVAALSAVLLHFFGGQLVALMGVEAITPFLMLLPLAMFCGAALETAQQWLIRKQRFKVTARVAVAHSIIHNIGRSTAGLIHASAAMLVITTALGPLLHAGMLFFGIRRDKAIGRKHPEDQPTEVSTILGVAGRYSDFPIYRAPQMLINAVSQNLPTLVLAAYFGASAAGFFAICKQTLSMPTHLIGKSVADVYYPKLAKAIQEEQAITGMLLKAFIGLAAVGLVPFATVFFFGPWLFSFVFGTEWAIAGEFARWLALSEYAVFISRPCTVAAPALRLQRRYLAIEVISTIMRVSSLFIGALWLQDALGTVIAFAMASIFIYTSLIFIVLYEARKWHKRLTPRS